MSTRLQKYLQRQKEEQELIVHAESVSAGLFASYDPYAIRGGGETLPFDSGEDDAEEWLEEIEGGCDD